MKRLLSIGILKIIVSVVFLQLLSVGECSAEKSVQKLSTSLLEQDFVCWAVPIENWCSEASEFNFEIERNEQARKKRSINTHEEIRFGSFGIVSLKKIIPFLFDLPPPSFSC